MNRQPATWNPDAVETAPERVGRGPVVHLDDLDDGRCKASSWRHPLPAKPTYENHFGPGGYNRCIGDEGHANRLHKDEWGYVFRAEADGGFRIVRLEQIANRRGGGR